MSLIRILKPGLFLYEVIKLLILTFMLYSAGQLDSMRVLYPASVLMPLLTLFYWLDSDRYRPYLNLIIAVKCIGIFVTAGWCIASKDVTIVDSYFLSGDLLSLAAVLFIFRDFQKSTQTGTEEN
ncbi:MAG: hypothetical protein FWC01_07815 [Treponema sp.]|nr:hypothetical protein [Treponema sp.]MCL2237916.1 hypothetical protein [Treponema sp.]